jgi:hypothetical protein
LIVKGINAVLSQLFEGDGRRIVLAPDDDGFERRVGLQGLRKGLSTSWTKAVSRSIQLQRGTEERKESQKDVTANRNGRLIAYLGHRRVTLQQLCHDEHRAIHVKPLPAVVQGVHCVLAKLIDMDGDVLVLAAENNGAQCLVCLQGLRDGLSALWTQLVPGSMELHYPT